MLRLELDGVRGEVCGCRKDLQLQRWQKEDEQGTYDWFLWGTASDQLRFLRDVPTILPAGVVSSVHRYEHVGGEDSTNQVGGGTIRRAKGRIPQSLPKLTADFLRDSGSETVLLLAIERPQTELSASRRNKNLILRHVSGRSMVLPVRNAPRMVGDTKTEG